MARIVYNIAMKTFLKLIFTLFLIFFSVQITKAEEYKILVLPDNIQFDSTNYLVYPDTSIIFASDIINEIKKNGKVEIVSMAEVRDALRKNTKLKILTKNAIKEFKYNYNIPFVDFQGIAHCFGVDKILIITSQTDVQNYFLRRTLWDFLNIPGATVINPAYKLSTYAALIDVDKEIVIWQNTYYKTIDTMECRIVAQNFAPATEQLEKIKNYSMTFLSPTISSVIQSKILPPPILSPSDNGIVDVSSHAPIDTTPTIEDIDLKPKMVAPTKKNLNNFGVIINDL